MALSDAAHRVLTVMVGALVVFTLGAVASAALLTPPPAPARPAGPDTAHLVNVAITETFAAAARLSAYEDADLTRRLVILSRAEGNLSAGSLALTQVHVGDPATQAQVATATVGLRTLADRVTALHRCAAAGALTVTAGADPAGETGQDSAPSTSTGGETEAMSSPDADPTALCGDPAILTKAIAEARSTGTAVAALIPLSSLSTDQVTILADSVRTQARTEGRAGATSTIRIPPSLLAR